MTRSDQVLEITKRVPLFPDLPDAWQNRGLLWMLVRRNIKVRYQQTLLGVSWAVFQPLLLAGLLTVVAGIVLGAPSNGLPYILFAFSGTALWSFFQRVVNDTALSFAGNGSLVLKVYFPRILIPISAALTAVADLVPVMGLLILMIGLYGRLPLKHILIAPVFVLLGLLLA